MPADTKNISPIEYEIQVAGRLSPEWGTWFEGMTLRVVRGEQGETITALRGTIQDQAALFGMLTRIRDLGLRLVSINRMMSELRRR
jgi:hypothetical protein